MRIREENRGKHLKVKAEKNRAEVVEYFKENPASTLAEASVRLGLSTVTVRNHIRAYEAGK